MTILDEIVAKTKLRVAAAEQNTPLENVCKEALDMPKGEFAFEKALNKPRLSFICEVKKASPSKGVIAVDFPYLDIAKSYEEAGADAISVLTEPAFFMGNDSHLAQISATRGIPTLRKDFVISEYQIYEAKLLGAAAVLLICAVLDEEELTRFISISRMLGLSALVETRTAEEIEVAIGAGASIVGINNRDLRTFQVDLSRTAQLRELVPSDVLFVAESGITSVEDIRALSAAKPDAVLIGEAFMRSQNKGQFLASLKGAATW